MRFYCQNYHGKQNCLEFILTVGIILGNIARNSFEAVFLKKIGLFQLNLFLFHFFPIDVKFTACWAIAWICILISETFMAFLSFVLGAAILRIPILYGEVEKLEESAVTTMFDKVQFNNKSANMDHWQQRFPTYVKDVAIVCRQLAERRMVVRTFLYVLYQV